MEKYLGDDDLMFNTATRVPVCLCLDLSGSMLTITDMTGAVKLGRQEVIDGETYELYSGGRTRLDELNEGLKAFYKAVQGDEMARDACELAVVGFSDEVVKLQDFINIAEEEPLQVQREVIGNNTNMDLGINYSLDLLEERKNDYKRAGREYIQPWLVVMSDGVVDAMSVTSSQNRAKNLEGAGKLTMFQFIIGNDTNPAIDVLSGFSNKRKPMKIKEGKIEEFFEWLGKSVVVVSQSKPGEHVNLPKDNIDSFFDLDN